MLVKTDGHVKDTALCCLCTSAMGIIALHTYLRCQEGKMSDWSDTEQNTTKLGGKEQELGEQ